MKKTRLLTSIMACLLVLSLGACETGATSSTGKGTIESQALEAATNVTGETIIGETNNTYTPSDDDPVFDHTITFEGNGYVYPVSLARGANTGEEVYFKLLVESGYSISEVSVTYKGMVEQVIPSDDDEGDPTTEWVEGDIELELSGSKRKGFTFIMPEADVTIRAAAVGAYFMLTYDTTEVVYTDYRDYSYKADSILSGFYEPTTGTKICDGSGNYIQAGTELLVVAKHQNTAENLKIYANGVELEEVIDPSINAGYYAFLLKMPAKDCVLTFDIELRYVDISIVEDDRLDTYLYLDQEAEKDETCTTLSGVDVNNTNYYVYAKVKDEYAEDWGISSITVSWTQYSSETGVATSESSTTTSWSSTSLNANATGSFAYIDESNMKAVAPSAFYAFDEVTITFDFLDYTTYKGSLFVGTWTGYEFFNQGKYGNLASTTIDGAGNMTSSTSTAALQNRTVTSVTDEGYAVLSDGRIFYTNGTLAYLYWNSSTGSAADVWILAKGVTDISMDYFAPSTKMHVIRVFDQDGQELGNIFANEDDEAGIKYYFDVNITFSDDTTSLGQDGATFTITDNDGNTLYSRQALYSEAAFVGTWTGYEFKNSSKQNTKATVTIDRIGEVTSSTTYLNDKTVTSLTEEGYPVFDDGRIFYNDGSIAFIYYSSSSGSASDVWILAKDVEDISLDFYAVSSTRYVMRVLNQESEVIGTLYADEASETGTKYYFGVTITFNEGTTTLAETGAEFIVTDSGGNELFSRQPIYADCPFVGTWTPSNFYSSSSHSLVSTFTIDALGDITGNSTFTSYKVSDVSSDGYDVTLSSSSSTKTFYTNGTVGIMYYSSSCNDVWVCAKGYTDFDQEYWASSANLWLDILKDKSTGEVIGALFADSELSPDIYAGVTISYTSQGDTLADSTFTVSDRNGNLLYTKS